MFSSASIEKGKRASIQGYSQEQERVMGVDQVEWQNPNIDKTMARTHAVRVVENEHDGSVEAAILGRIAKAGVKRMRKDAVTHLTVYASMPDYSARSEEERRQFEESVKRFLEKRYGEGNVVDMRWHFDESTPHLHATVVPITADGRLCAKELFKPTKKSMEQWQRDYYHEVAAPLHYSQPDFGRSAEKGYTAETKATREQLECVQGSKAAVEQEVAELEAQIESERARGRALGERARDLEGAVEELGGRVGELEDEVGRERGRAVGLEDEVERSRGRLERLEGALRRVVAAVRRVPAALEMAAQALPEGFIEAMRSFEAGMRALEMEPEVEAEMVKEYENVGLDELLNNYSEQEEFGNGGYRGYERDDDLDL